MNRIKESFLKNRIGILLMTISSICACVGQLLWKLSDGNINFLLITGFIFYGVGALIMLIAYKFGSLSVLQPILSLNYALSIILAYFFLNEPITTTRVIGILIIMLGAILIGGGND